MRVLILGSEGGLGQAFMDVYQDEKPVGLDRGDLDVANQVELAAVFEKQKPELVINCTGYTAVDNAETDRATAEAVNGTAPGLMASECKKTGATLVHFSSGMVFAGSKEEGYNEDDVPDPVNAYGQSKLMGEMEVQKNMDNFYIVRSTWLFGKTKSGKKSFIDLMLAKAAANEPIKCVIDEVGSPTYDHDLAQATRAMLEVKKPFGIYHITNAGRANRFDWAEEIFRLKDIDADVQGIDSSEFPPRAAKRPKFEIVNNTKFIQLRPWQEALEEFLSSN